MVFESSKSPFFNTLEFFSSLVIAEANRDILDAEC